MKGFKLFFIRIVMVFVINGCAGMFLSCDRSNEPTENNPIENDSANNKPVEFGEFVYNDSIKGDLKTYKGEWILALANSINSSSGLISIVFASENKVYLFGLNENLFVGSSSNNRWVCGKIEDNIIQIPCNSECYQYSYYGHHVLNCSQELCIVLYHPDGQYEETNEFSSIYFKINPDNSLHFCKEFYPSFYNGDEYKFAIKSYKSETYTPTNEETETTSYVIFNEYLLKPIDVLPPNGKIWKSRRMEYDIYNKDKDDYSPRTATANICIDDEDVYIVVDKCVLRGKISGDKIVFEDKQYVSLQYQFISPAWCGINKNEKERYLMTGELNKRLIWPELDPLNLPLKVTYNAKTHELGEADHDFSLGSAIFLNVKFGKSE